MREMMIGKLLSNARVSRTGLFGAALLGTLMLAGCGGVPATHYYTVAMPAAAPAADAGTPVTLDIARFSATQALRDDRILYYQSPTELNYYEYHRWTAQPAEMLAEFIARRLKASGAFSRVSLFPHSAPGDYILHGRLLNFEELDYEAGGHVRVALELSLVRSSNHKVIWSETGRAERGIQGKGVAAVADALNACTTQITDRILPELVQRVKRDEAPSSAK